MRKIFVAAFNELKKMGVPVYEHTDDNGNFSISAEESNSDEWVDMYNSDFDIGVNPVINEALFKHGLFCEWVNAGRLSIYKI